MRTAIIGAGVVGKAVNQLIGGQAIIHDPRAGFCTGRGKLNRCDIAFVCVPTPSQADGGCDVAIVERVITWMDTPLIVICSTVAPGTTDNLRHRYCKRVVYQPQYIGETSGHPYQSITEGGFVVLGGPDKDVAEVSNFLKPHCGASVRFIFCKAILAELAKYMENAFFAAKVAFVNEFHEIAKAHRAEYDLLREIWLADSRVSSDHTDVYAHARGFSGKCLPKDLAAIIASSTSHGYHPELLAAIQGANRRFTMLTGQERADRPGDATGS